MDTFVVPLDTTLAKPAIVVLPRATVPVTVNAEVGAALLIPTLLLVPSTKNVPLSKLTFADAVKLPVMVVLPAASVVIPDNAEPEITDGIKFADSELATTDPCWGITDVAAKFLYTTTTLFDPAGGADVNVIVFADTV